MAGPFPVVRRRGESPSEALTRPLRGMRGPLPGTKVRRNGIQVRRWGGSTSELEVAERPEGRACRPRAAQRSEPRHGDPRKASPPGAKNLRGRVGDRRPSAAAPFTRTPQGRRLPGACDGHGSSRGSKTRPRSAAKRSEGSGRNRQRVRTRNRERSGPGHIYTYIPLPTQHERPSPRTTSGGRTRVCVGARARACFTDSGAHCKRKTVTLFTE